jgi:replicative DNA helicase
MPLNPSDIKDLEIEKYCLSLIISYPDFVIDYGSILGEEDFTSDLNRVIFSVIKSKKFKGEQIDKNLLSSQVKGLGIDFDGIDPFDYIVYGLGSLSINASKAKDYFHSLKLVTARREIEQAGLKIARQMKSMSDASIDEILSAADQLYNGKISLMELGDEFPDIYESLEERIEFRGNNPLTEMGLMGPWPKVNELFGSLLRDGNITLIGARSGVGKTATGMYYLNWVADKYNVPILHLDCGEMSPDELQDRAISMLAEKPIPLHMIERGTWRQNEETTRMVRAAITRAKRIKHYYRDISGKSRDEIKALIKRFYFSKIGRGNKVLIHYDYLKPFDLSDLKNPEWKEMGHFVQEIKSLVKELSIPFWTSLQLNRYGITNNKTAANLDDSENTFSISDRIYQQVSHAFLLRQKLMEEQATEIGFGNTKMIPLKTRHLGEGFADVLNPVKMPDGSFKKNFIHLDISGFQIKELGDLASTASQIGQIKVDEEDDDDGVLI